LSSAAGWNQTEEDWRRLSRIQPDGVGIWKDDGEARASYSVVRYGGGLSWIGMILADPAYRGRGLGKAAFAEALERAKSGNSAVIGLDATEMGEPIYRQFGFERTGDIIRWSGDLLPGEGRGDPGIFSAGLSEEVCELDRLSTGIDRTPLLRDLAETAEILRCEREGATAAFAAIRPGRRAAQIGPLVARTPEDFETLFREISRRLAGRTVVCDVPRGEAALRLQPMGLQPSRRLRRMTLPATKSCLAGEAVWFAAGFEWG
jgi:GNAT superfamily N-acetyltransferase